MTVEQQVNAVREELVDARTAVERLAGQTTEAEWTTRPPGGGWSASECVVHLTLTSEAFLPRLERARASTPPARELPPRYRVGPMASLLVWWLQPSRGRVRTRPTFEPARVLPKRESVAGFDASQAHLLAWMDAAAGERLDRIVIASPFAEQVRYHAYAALRLVAVHQRRHLAQADHAIRSVRKAASGTSDAPAERNTGGAA